MEFESIGASELALDDGEIEALLDRASQASKDSEQTEEKDVVQQVKDTLGKLPKVGVTGVECDSAEPETKPAVREFKLRKIENPIKAAVERKLAKEADAGDKWFRMPKPKLDDELKRDLQILQMRNVLDPKRHYRKEKIGTPKFFQRGTIIQGNTEFFSARLNRKQRRQTLADELLADPKSREYFDRKFAELQGKAV